ncbi:hypothetical protein CTA1_2760, partial [Colletotrichum tanaceti]
SRRKGRQRHRRHDNGLFTCYSLQSVTPPPPSLFDALADCSGPSSPILLADLLPSTNVVMRWLSVKNWRILPWTMWLVLLIYFFSFLFVFSASILQFAFGADLNIQTCSAAMLFCLGAYVTTKFVYLFMVDRAHIIRQTRKGRLRSKLYLVNSFGMLGMAHHAQLTTASAANNPVTGVFLLIVIMNFIFRITHFENGICIIGMEQPVLLPLISFDAAVNVSNTLIGWCDDRNLIRPAGLHSVKYNFWKAWTLDWRNRRIPRAPPNIRLRKLVIRTFIGSCCTLLSSVTNLTVLMALNGEVAWLCLLCCNTDICFSALVINWITSPGHEATLRTLTRPSRGGGVSALVRDAAASIPLDRHKNTRPMGTHGYPKI